MNFKRSATLLLIALTAVSMIATPAMAAADFNDDATAAQNPYISTDVTISTYDRGEMSPGQYEDDSGDIATLPATISQSTNVDDIGSGSVNPYGFVTTDIEFADSTAFPHAETNVSAVENETKWTVDTSNTAGSMTVSDSSTAPEVSALGITASSQTGGDAATATFSDFQIRSDANKRYLQAVMDITELDVGTTVELRAVDTDGDYVATRINSSASASDDDVIATGTGEGYVIQQQIGSLTTQGTGDGTMAEIDAVEIVVEGGDAAVDISALNVDKTSEWSFGDRRVETDGDGDIETETIRDVTDPGQISVYNLDTMGTTFENAVINGLEIPMHFQASDLSTDSSRVNVTFSAASNYPSFDTKQTARYRLRLPAAYDLTYANAELRQEISLPTNRYQSISKVEGAGDTAFDDITGWTDITDSIASDSTVTLDDTIQPGQEIALRSVTLVTADERSAVEDIDTAGAGQFGSSDGDLLDMILSPLGGIVAGLGALWARIRGAI